MGKVLSGGRKDGGFVQNLILIGSGGCMRELLWQIEESKKECPIWMGQNGNGAIGRGLDGNATTAVWNVLGYVDRRSQGDNGVFDIFAGNTCCPYLGDDDYLLSMQQETNVVVSVGEPQLRKKIAEKLKRNPNLKFPNLILGDARICSDLKMGQGCIISMGSRVSTNVTFGDFVFLNMGTVVCHDGNIGDFCTLSPEVTLAGQVTMGDECDLGVGTKVIQGIHIGNRVIAGAGSVVTRDVEDGCTVVGVPAKRMEHPNSY